MVCKDGRLIIQLAATEGHLNTLFWFEHSVEMTGQKQALVCTEKKHFTVEVGVS